MKYLYWIVTSLFCGLMLFSSGMYFINHHFVATEFIKLGFPTWIVYPLAGLKLAGVVVILWRKNQALVEWAYAGFFFNILIAFTAHMTIADGEQWSALVALLLSLTSYFLGKKVRPII
jgi:glucose dehydrogenase